MINSKLKDLNSQIKNFKRNQDNYALLKGYINLGNNYKSINQKLALSYFKKALKILENINENFRDEGLNVEKFKLIINYNIGNIYQKMFKINKAINFYNKALKISNELKDPIFTGIISSTLLTINPELYIKNKEKLYEQKLNNILIIQIIIWIIFIIIMIFLVF